MFTSDELFERFHHFLHDVISTGIEVIQHLPDDFGLDDSSASETTSARLWCIDAKEKLLIALTKIFSLNMPLYITYKHTLYSHGRYSKLKECSCTRLSADPLTLLQSFCQTAIFGNQRNQVGHHFFLKTSFRINISLSCFF